MRVYLDTVYGESTLHFPLDILHNTFFWENIPWRQTAKIIESHSANTPFGSLFHIGFKGGKPFTEQSYGNGANFKRSHNSSCGFLLDNFVEFRNGTHVQRPVFSDHSRIEVSHMCCDDHDESPGTWFFYAPGSGVYYDIGVTAAFSDKICACEYFKSLNNTMGFDCKICCGHVHHYLLPVAKAFGYDSIIFYDSIPGGWPSSIEIWDIRDLRKQSANSGACPHLPAHNSSCSTCIGNYLYAGHKGILPCDCDPTSITLRCRIPRLDLHPILSERRLTHRGHYDVENELPLNCTTESWNVTLILTGDMHGFVDTVPELVKDIALIKQRSRNVVTLSAGDAFVGSSFFRKYGPMKLGHVLRQVNFDFMGLGNHD